MPSTPPAGAAGTVDRYVICNPDELATVKAFLRTIPVAYRPTLIFTTSKVPAGLYWVWSAVPLPILTFATAEATVDVLDFLGLLNDPTAGEVPA